jgi:hypothetical protein
MVDHGRNERTSEDDPHKKAGIANKKIHKTNDSALGSNTKGKTKFGQTASDPTEGSADNNAHIAPADVVYNLQRILLPRTIGKLPRSKCRPRLRD